MMYADFLFFDHFLVVDFLSSFLWRLMCGKVFHILKVAFQYEYMMIGSPLNQDLVEIPSVIDWPVMELCSTPFVFVAVLEKASLDWISGTKFALCSWYTDFLML